MIRNYGIDQRVERMMRMHDAMYQLDEVKLRRHMRESLVAVLVRLLPDVLAGNILLKEPARYV